MRAIILAAGRGRRLMPLTNFIAKPLLPVDGKPIIWRILKNIEEIGVRDAIIVIGHLGWQIRKYLKDEELGINLRFVEQEKQLGTAHALNLCSDFMKGDFFVMASDSIFPTKHLKELLKFHSKQGCDATLSLKRLPPREIEKSSIVSLRGDSVLKIIEKPFPGEITTDVASSPLYVFNEKIKSYLRVKKSERGEYELQDAIQGMIDSGLKVKGIFCEEWKHLSDIRDFLGLNFRYMGTYLKN